MGNGWKSNEGTAIEVGILKTEHNQICSKHSGKGSTKNACLLQVNYSERYSERIDFTPGACSRLVRALKA